MTVWLSIIIILLSHPVIEHGDLLQPTFCAIMTSALFPMDRIFSLIVASGYVNMRMLLISSLYYGKKTFIHPRHINRKHIKPYIKLVQQPLLIQFRGNTGNYSSTWCFMKAPKHFQFYFVIISGETINDTSRKM